MDEQPSDGDLWQLMSRGDEGALGVLFERHAQRIFRFLVRMLATRQDAEDVVTETFLEAWRVRRSMAVTDSAVPLLLAIARRRAQDHLRASSRRARLLNRVAVQRPEPAWPDPEEIVTDREVRNGERRLLRDMVMQLPTDQRSVVELCIFAEMSYEECAAIFDVPIGTIKSRLSQAKEKLAATSPVVGCTLTGRKI